MSKNEWLHSYCRGQNWYVSRWGAKEVFNPFTPWSARIIRCYVMMDNGSIKY